MTTEKLIQGQILPPVPRDSPYYNYGTPNVSSGLAGQGSTAASTPSTNSRIQSHDDLIKRYNLTNRVSVDHNAETPREVQEKYEWSKKREERETLLRRRKEDAILRARQNLIKKEGL